jgi:hypothetical protein
MNTTTLAAVSVFSSFFSTKEEYLSFKAHWKGLANEKAITPIDAALRILVLNQDALRSMPPTKNPVRIANGALYCSGLARSMSDLSYEARRAKYILNKREQGDDLPLSDFAGRWAKHGISLAALASLEALADATSVLRAC